MKRIRKYQDEPLGRLEVVKDFLPPPDRLVLRDDGVKITISLSKRSVDFFKRHAARSKVPYQKMIDATIALRSWVFLGGMLGFCFGVVSGVVSAAYEFLWKHDGAAEAGGS